MVNQRFAKWMRDRRHEMKPVPSQVRLSEIIGVSQEAVSKWERSGVASLPPRTIIQIATAFGVDPVDVAAALGYPTRPRQTAMMPMKRDVWYDRVSDLGARLEAVQVRVLQQWAEEVMPGEETERRTPQDHSG